MRARGEDAGCVQHLSSIHADRVKNRVPVIFNLSKSLPWPTLHVPAFVLRLDEYFLAAIDSAAVEAFTAGQTTSKNLLNLQAIELLWRSRGHSVRDRKRTVRIKRVGGLKCPVARNQIS